MADLIYTSLCSLDGFINDVRGEFDWAAPDEEVHAFVNDLERSVGTYLLGRRTYEVLKVWDILDEPEPVMQDYAEVWRGADKIVFSRTLTQIEAPRTSLRSALTPEDLMVLKAGTQRDLAIGGAVLAGQTLSWGLVDEVRLFLAPVAVVGGTAVFQCPLRLGLVEQRRFDSGFVYLRYRVT